MTIHTTHPFAEEPDPARRLRGRLGGAVTLWTAGAGGARAGLTVTSVLAAMGPEPALLALLDPDADLTLALEETERAVVHLLSWPDRGLAEAFAGTAPAPGGPFRQAEFVDGPSGPRLAASTSYAEVVLVDARPLGWSLEVTCRLDTIEIGTDAEPLLHRRGRYYTV